MHPSQLVTVLGASAATALMQRWGGHRIPAWTAPRVTRAQRNDAVRRAFDTLGTNLARIATQYGLSERHVRRILNGK